MSQGGASCLVLANNNPLRGGGHLGLYNGSFRHNSYKCNLRVTGQPFRRVPVAYSPKNISIETIRWTPSSFQWRGATFPANVVRAANPSNTCNRLSPRDCRSGIICRVRSLLFKSLISHRCSDVFSRHFEWKYRIPGISKLLGTVDS